MQKYCKLDVEVLARTVLIFRKLFIESLDVDPFRYVTLASLCMSIYTSKFLPDKSIVANATDKHISLVCKEWLIYLNDDNIVPEVPLFVDSSRIRADDRHKHKVSTEPVTYYNQAKCIFTVDGYNKNSNTVMEMYGCYWHGCKKCFPKLTGKYDKTMERKNIRTCRL